MTRRLFVAVAIASLVGPRPLRADERLLAVLEIKSKLGGAEAASVDAAYLTDVIRSAALEALPGLRVMTRENMFVLVQSAGKSLADCEGECEVDTGRKLGADLVVSGELLKFGSKFKLDLRLHDTREGRLLSGAQASGKSVDELDEATGAAVKKLFVGLQPPAAASGAATTSTTSRPAATPGIASTAAEKPATPSASPTSVAPTPVAAQAAAPTHPPTPALEHKLQLRLEAIHNAAFLERKACADIVPEGRFPVKSESDVSALCPRFGDRFDIELFDKPHEVDAVADSDPTASYRVTIGCSARCHCVPDVGCFRPETVYRGMVGEKLAPEINSATVKADYALIEFSDEARGIYGVDAKMCLLGHPKTEEVARACADPSIPVDDKKAKVIVGKPFTLLGETSGALIPFGCEFHCGCDGSSRCGVTVKPQGFNVATFEDVAEKLKRPTATMLRAIQDDLLPPGDAIFYLNPPAHLYPAKKE